MLQVGNYVRVYVRVRFASTDEKQDTGYEQNYKLNTCQSHVFTELRGDDPLNNLSWLFIQPTVD